MNNLSSNTTNGDGVKYFFLADGWTTGRVWEFSGLWNEQAKRRKPYLKKQSLCIHENGELLWLFQAEESILMLEVKPKTPACASSQPIGQVMLKRLLSADQVIERLCEENVFQPHWRESDTRIANTDPTNTDVTNTKDNLAIAITHDAQTAATKTR
ncbi:MAG: hypothetical protein AAF703_16165 [Cyanobacteria bacterium P01_D01_bin.105]